MVDSNSQVVVDEIINLEDDHVVSYLTPLTGLTKELCSKERRSLLEVVDIVKQALPEDAVLVGQSIEHDIDFRESIDISHIFRTLLPRQLKATVEGVKSGTISISSDTCSLQPSQQIPTKYRIFSLRHCCLHLFAVDIQTSFHDPVIDAQYSIMLFHKYRQENVAVLRATRDKLHKAPRTPSFASQFPLIDGVCFTKEGYRYKEAARFILKWWQSLFGGYLIPKLKNAK